MKFNKMYIISYFGTDEKMIERRKKFHRQQLDWCKSQGLTPVVLAQHYRDVDYESDVEYIINNDTLLRPGQARDVLLYHFYNSDDDFAIFADNDCYLYSGEKYGYSSNFVELMRNIPLENFRNIDMFMAVDPSTTPFTDDLKENSNIDKEYLRFAPCYVAQGFFVLKNLQKHHNKQIYHDEKFVKEDGSMLACEDQDFPINLITNYLGVYVCKNIIKKEHAAGTTSTWIDKDKDLRWSKTQEGLDYISEKYNLPIQTEYNIGIWARIFKKRFNYKSTKVKLTQMYEDHVYDLFENL